MPPARDTHSDAQSTREFEGFIDLSTAQATGVLAPEVEMNENFCLPFARPDVRRGSGSPDGGAAAVGHVLRIAGNRTLSALSGSFKADRGA